MKTDPFISLDDLFPKSEDQAIGDSSPRCDFAFGKRSVVSLSPNIAAITLWRRSILGMTLSEIKEKTDLPDFFARNLSNLISSIIGKSLQPDQFVVVAPPKRRHPGPENFASRMCAMIARNLAISYIDDFAVCRNRQRIDPDFKINADIPPQNNIIVVDDILTTGSTLKAMSSLIYDAGRNPIIFAGILNKF